jgi:lipopolysaccharide export LptBFGC system permease protein LptF
MKSSYIYWLVCLSIVVFAIVGFICVSFIFPRYSYQGVAEMSQSQYSSFMKEYGFKDKDQQNFATAYNQQSDKLIVTYNFESRSTKLEKYGIEDGKTNYGDVPLMVFLGSVAIFVLILCRPSKDD